MRTTIVLDDDLLKQVKKLAADRGKTVSQLVSDALRDQLRRRDGPRPGRFRMITFGGSRKVHHEPADFYAEMEHDDVEGRA